MPAFPPGANIKGGANAAPVLRQVAAEFYAPIIPVVVELRQQGLSLRAIARELTARGVPLRYMESLVPWSAQQVKRVLARAAAIEPGEPAPASQPAECHTSQEPQGARPAAHLPSGHPPGGSEEEGAPRSYVVQFHGKHFLGQDLSRLGVVAEGDRRLLRFKTAALAQEFVDRDVSVAWRRACRVMLGASGSPEYT
jgi:hypothetical protein